MSRASQRGPQYLWLPTSGRRGFKTEPGIIAIIPAIPGKPRTGFMIYDSPARRSTSAYAEASARQVGEGWDDL